jgi:hypothetical protein
VRKKWNDRRSFSLPRISREGDLVRTQEVDLEVTSCLLDSGSYPSHLRPVVTHLSQWGLPSSHFTCLTVMGRNVSDS